MADLPIERHLLRGRDLADRHYSDAEPPIGVADMAAAAGLSQAHFARAFRDAFGVTPHGYLLTRRLERAAALLRETDRSVADICTAVGLSSVGSFTTSFKRMFGRSPSDYRAAYPPLPDRPPLPGCVVRWAARPEHRSFREDPAPVVSLASSEIPSEGAQP
ncbi:MAG TPA: helix-turn-helix transcriptional regulator [Nocardioides sp.]|uniref:helix-turn-helix transcriptional regulator n=1 Tax=Nocardioides sp. TaxID=35761 RepID=UPI002ED97854